MPFRNIPIQRKLMAIILVTTIATLLLIRTVFFVFEYAAFRQATLRQLSTVGEVIAANSTAALAFENREDAEETLAALKAEPHITAAALYNNAGNVFAKYPADLPDAALPAKLEKAGYHFERFALLGFQPVVQGGKPKGMLYLKLDTGAVMRQWFRDSIGITAVVVAFAFGVAYLISRQLQKQISQPILTLTETAKAISERRDYSVRAAKLGDDELGLLTDAFNQMLTQIHQQNQALKDSEERVRAIINSALSAVVVIDSSGRITDWNDRAEQMFGWSRSEAGGRDLAEIIIPPRYREAHQRGMKHFLATGEGPVLNRSIELSALRRDGSEFPVELSISPVKTDGAVTFCGFITDITERKEAQEKVAREQERFKLVFDSVPIGIAYSVVQPDGQYTRIINDAHLQICGLTREQDQLPGIYLRITHPEDAARQQELGSGLGPDRVGKISMKKRYIKLNGEVVWVTFIFQRRKCADGSFEELTTVVDITELKSAEAEIRKLNITLEQRVAQRTSQLEAVNKELEAFSYSVSHDLRAPLRHITGFADMLRQNFAATLNETGQRYLGIISNSARQMGVLIDDLLVFSRMGRSELRRTDVNMGGQVTEVLREMANDLAGRKIVWDIGPLPEVHGDRAMLKQVWVNLLSNAVKYSRHREQATIKVNSRTNEHSEWEFSVSDNGAGFDMQYAGKLFGVFQRLHMAEEFEGTGIGLANVQRIVLRHGGRVWAEGQVDVGATFYFTLPITGEINT